MRLKFVQVNVYRWKYFDNLAGFLKEQDPDFVSMQEVAFGSRSFNRKHSEPFKYLYEKLGMESAFGKAFDIADESGFEGNAVLSRYPIGGTHIVPLTPLVKLDSRSIEDPKNFPLRPRLLLDAACDVGGTKVRVMSWHGAWTAPPYDTEETLRQAQLVADYLKSLKEPFILGVDANNVPESKTIGIVDEVANNLMKGSGVAQTTHPKVHKIVPRGYLIDYIFASEHFSLQSLSVPQVLISDHLPVVADFEFQP